MKVGTKTKCIMSSIPIYFFIAGFIFATISVFYKSRNEKLSNIFIASAVVIVIIGIVSCFWANY